MAQNKSATLERSLDVDSASEMGKNLCISHMPHMQV